MVKTSTALIMSLSSSLNYKILMQRSSLAQLHFKLLEFFLLINSPRLNLRDQIILKKLDFMMFKVRFLINLMLLKKLVDLFMPPRAISYLLAEFLMMLLVFLTAILEYLKELIIALEHLVMIQFLD